MITDSPNQYKSHENTIKQLSIFLFFVAYQFPTRFSAIKTELKKNLIDPLRLTIVNVRIKTTNGKNNF